MVCSLRVDDNTGGQEWQGRARLIFVRAFPYLSCHCHTLMFYGKNYAVDWIYLSPHLDDVALSCGGLVWEQAVAGERVIVVTICAGDPPPGQLSKFAEGLHARWGIGQEAAAARRAEDRCACQRMGAIAWHLSIPDCIYRLNPYEGSPLYPSEEALLGPLNPVEAELVASLQQELSQSLPSIVNLVCPLAVGGHVDHRLVRTVAEGLGRPLWYYADAPYVLRAVEALEGAVSGMRKTILPVTESGLEAWIEAIALHASQISTFWPDLQSMRVEISAYCRQAGGVRLWQNI